MALQHISQLAEELNKTDVRRSSRPTAPPAFRRSLSTSEVEEYREYVEYAQQQEEEALSRAADLHTQTPDAALPLATKPPSTPVASADTNGDVTDTSAAQLRSRSSFRRAFSAQVPDVQITSATGRSSRPGSARNSMYASGTQSAYSSRDASPDRRGFGVRKITPYPVAPPSFLITPSRTPRRVTASVDREISMPEKHLQRLYDKLSAIEKEQTEEEGKKQQRFQREGSIEAQTEAIDSKRKSGMRMLVKSMSVDSYREDPNWMPSEAVRDPNAHFCPKQLDTVFDDAPKSQTLPASVRVGALTIVPGQDQLTSAYGVGKMQAFNSRRKSQDARKEFYENYPLYSSGFFSWPRKSRRDKHQEAMAAALAASEEEAEKKASQKKEESMEVKPTASTTETAQDEPKKVIVPIGRHKKDKEEKEKKESKFSYFFSSVKERRKMFMKKSKSVDESPVRKSVMQAGLQAGRAAAPSTFEPPPEVKESTPTSTTTSRPSSLRMRFHKRAASLDVTSLFSVSSSTSGGTGSSSEQGPSTSTSGSGSGQNRHSSTGTSGVSSMTSSSSAGSTSGSGSKDQSRDGRRF